MDGVTNSAYRQIVRSLSKDVILFSEFTSVDGLVRSDHVRLRLGYEPCEHPFFMQLFGNSPEIFAEASRMVEERGILGVDINMGCPAKKVNKKLAGSALLQYPDTVEAIIKAVVNAVDVPVTLKIRTGWNPENRNGVEIARIAEQNGIQSLAVHGRTRACMYKGEAEYSTIRQIKAAISIPVIANGDITSPEKAQEVLNYTGADGVMIGRGAQGKPWIFKQIQHYLETGENLPAPPLSELYELLHEHVANVQDFYGDIAGVRIARKHVGWYLAEHDTDRQFRKTFNAIDDANEQLDALNAYFQALQTRETRQISPAA